MKGTTNIPCVYVLVRQKGKLLLVLRTHTGYKDGTYCLPSGHVEAGESFRVAAARETIEETNVQVAVADLRHVHTLHRYDSPTSVRVDLFLEADTWQGEPRNMEPERHGAVEWFPMSDLPFDTIMDFQAEALRAIARGETYSEFGWERSLSS
jgi:8-oxo-dGTP diphosphatase